MLVPQQGIEPTPCSGSMGSQPQDCQGSLVLAFRSSELNWAQKGSRMRPGMIFAFSLWMLTEPQVSLNNSETDCCETTQFSLLVVIRLSWPWPLHSYLPEKRTQVVWIAEGIISVTSLSELGQSEPLLANGHLFNFNKHCNRPGEGSKGLIMEQDSCPVSNN